jgi:hypothetical protein
MAEDSRPFSFKEFDSLIAGIEMISRIGLPISDAVAQQRREFSHARGDDGFVKTMMSIVGFLRFIPSSKFYAKERDELTFEGD